MTSTTPHYNLILFNNTTDPSVQDFLDFRDAESGTGAGSNMNLIDTALHGLQTSITTLGTQLGLIKVYANEISTGNYVADSITGISSYVTNLQILLALDITSTGTCTININSLGTKSLMKINSAGSPVNIVSGDLVKERFYIFTYDGTRFIWDNAFSSDQVNVPSGVSGDFVNVATDKSIQTSTYDSTDFAVTAKGVTNGDTHDHVGGDGAQIDYNNLSNAPGYRRTFISEDFFTYPSPSSPFIVDFGTVTQLDGVAGHNGVITCASSGMDFSSLGKIFNPVNCYISICVRNNSGAGVGSGILSFGLLDTNTGVFSDMIGVKMANGLGTNFTPYAMGSSGTGLGGSVGDWLTATIYIDSTMSNVYYSFYDNSGVLQQSTTISITPSPSTGFYLAMRHTAGQANQYLDVDYISMNYVLNR